MHIKKLLILSAMLVAFTANAQDDKPDPVIIQKIREEGLNHSQVMEIAFYLTDASGPRLMQSPGYFRAAEWAKQKFAEWGLVNPHLEAWGDWGKGWELQKYYLALTAPYYKPLIGFPKTWTTGTNGLQRAEAVLVDAQDSATFEPYRGRLQGKIVLTPRTDTLKPTYTADALRHSDETLQQMAAYDPSVPLPAPKSPPAPAPKPQYVLTGKVKELIQREGAVAVLSTNPRNAEGTVFVQGGGPFAPNSPPNFLDIAMAYEDYMTIQRLIQHHIPAKLDIDVQSEFYDRDVKGYNVVAEIAGRDKNLREQLVMLGGHLDCWQSATGATDNAAGCAAAMEAIRILKQIGFVPRRTIRIALWGGEETGLFGSRAYVKNHFADSVTKKFNAEGDKLSVYFNLDNGSGKIRGIYLQGNAKPKDIFTQWFAPFADLGAGTITLQNTGGTDHLSFDAIGLPAFQFIQDPIEYGSRTHHSNMDSYDHLQPEDLKQAATIIASFIYNAAQREAKIPRKEIKAK